MLHVEAINRISVIRVTTKATIGPTFSGVILEQLDFEPRLSPNIKAALYGNSGFSYALRLSFLACPP